ncbi:MAG: cysteine--tRNA ligase [Candidatus Saccharimonadales bacterium]
MTLQLHNTLTKTLEPFAPINAELVTIYSCGPTVYDHVHIGNLSAFIAADTLRRVVAANGYNVKHVMNFTDVDDKTISRSAKTYPDLEPMDALKKLTTHYGDTFLQDMVLTGSDTNALTFIKATDVATIDGMKLLITELLELGFAYIADDGVYFSIEAYKKSGKTYGQLVHLTESNTSNERIQNDEYDKDSVHDFALWKTKKPGEPSWAFELNGHDLAGRPGWHIECSVMSLQGLGQPFDIHTGGIDLAFPHHENEIAQSTAGKNNSIYASMFVHNEHVLVDGKKMSKSLNNFYTLADLTAKGIDPLAFRLLVLQSHYRHQTNFSFDNVEAAANRLKNWRTVSALRHQTHDTLRDDGDKRSDDNAVSLYATPQAIIEALSRDLDTPEGLRIIDEAFTRLTSANISDIHRQPLVQLLETIDLVLGLQLIATTPDITDTQKQLILERQRARDTKNWQESDRIRDELAKRGIAIRDTSHGPIWEYL